MSKDNYPQIIPNQDKLFTDVFESREAQEKFSREFWESIKPDIEKANRARAESWQKLKNKIYK